MHDGGEEDTLGELNGTKPDSLRPIVRILHTPVIRLFPPIVTTEIIFH